MTEKFSLLNVVIDKIRDVRTNIGNIAVFTLILTNVFVNYLKFCGLIEMLHTAGYKKRKFVTRTH